MGPAAVVTSTEEDRISPVLSIPSFRMVQYIFQKWAEMPFRGAFGCCNIPDLKIDILHTLMAMIGQWYNENVNDG